MSVDIPTISPNVGRMKGRKAWAQNLNLAAISAAKVESSLGPRGAYKMVTYTRGPERVIKVTKDAVEVLGELEIQYPAVKTLAESARIHRQDVGDGVTTFVIIISSLLRGADDLMRKKTHPNVILNGYLSAAKEASRVFNQAVLPEEMDDDEVLDVADCGRGVLTPSIRADLKRAAARAESQGGIDLKRIRVVTKYGASISDSKLVKGVIVRKDRIDQSMPTELRDVKVAVLNTVMDVKPLELLMKGKGAFKLKWDITENGQIAKFKEEESRLNANLVAPLAKVGAKVVICRGKIAPLVAEEMSKQGMMAFSMVDVPDVDAVAEATGATSIGDVANIEPKDLGMVDKVSMEKIEAIDYAVIEAAKGSTILLRGSSVAETQDLERVVKNCIRLMAGIRKDAKAAWGGGATYMRAATRLREYALEFSGKEQMAIIAFADALEEVPSALIGNFGLSFSKVLPELRSYHARGMTSMGIGYGGCVDMEGKDGVRDLVLNNKILLSRAYEVAKLLLRVDEYIYVKELAMVHKQ